MNFDDRFKNLFKGIPIPAYIWQFKENKLILVDYNYTVEENYDGEIEKYLGVKAEEFYKDQSIVLEKLTLCIDEKKGFTSKIEIINKFTGEKNFILYKFDFIPPDIVILYENDITDYKITQEELNRVEKKYNSLISYMTDVVWTKDCEGNAIFVSPNVENVLGFTPEKIIHDESEQIWFGRIHPDDAEQIKAAYEDLFERNIRYDVEYRIKQKDGEWIWLRDIADLIYEKDGIKYADGVFFDITERKLAERKLSETEEKYKALVFNIPSVAWTTDYEGNTTFISPNIEKIYGFSPQEIYTSDGEDIWFGRIHPEDVDRVRESYNSLFENEEEFNIEYRIKKKDGEWIWLHDVANIIYEKNGVLYADGILSDITERKKIEEKVRKEREKAENYLNLVNVIIVALDRDGNVTMINKKGNDILGWNEGELIGKNWFDNCLPLQDRERVNEYFENLMTGELDVIPFYENSVITKNKEEKLITWSTILYRDSEGNVTGALSSGEDITERKQAEQKLKDSEEKYRLITESVNDLIFVIDENYEFEYINEIVFKNLLGYTKEDLIGKPILEMVHPEDVEKSLETIGKGIKEGDAMLESRIMDKSGIYHRIEFKGRIFINKDDRGKGFIIGREIT